MVSKGLRVGMALFIVSEVFFFFAFFWAFFWGALYPPMTIATSWPPEGVEPVPTWGIPFLNTLILLLSGATVTWAHHAIKEDDQQTAFKALVITVCLGLIFTGFQIFEYVEQIGEGFTLQDAIFGSAFYMATGFHGLHVQIGTIFLAVCMMRAYYAAFRPNKHVGFEAAAWYWHFVDVVWLFLFVWVYWWGGSLQLHHHPGRVGEPSGTFAASRPDWPAAARAAGSGRLFDGFLAVAPRCDACGLDLVGAGQRRRAGSVHRPARRLHRRHRGLDRGGPLRLAGLAAPPRLAAAVRAALPGTDAAVQGHPDRPPVQASPA